MNKNYRLSIDGIERATKIIDPVFQNSPQFISQSLSSLFNTKIVAKIETLNPIRSFKGRSADLLVAKATPNSQIICASAGNFGQAMAYCCQRKKIDLTVYVSKQANRFKIAMMEFFGANVIQFGDDFDDAKIEARKQAEDKKIRFVEDCVDIESLEGTGTIGLELLQFSEKIDAVLIAVGNGALFNGVSRAIKNKYPNTEMVAIQSQGAPAMVNSIRYSKLTIYDNVDTIADGIAVRVPVSQALEDMKGLVDRTILVNDTNIIKGMKVLHQHLGIVAEPSSAVGIAALIENPQIFAKKTIATVICGGNITDEERKIWLCN